MNSHHQKSCFTWIWNERAGNKLPTHTRGASAAVAATYISPITTPIMSADDICHRARLVAGSPHAQRCLYVTFQSNGLPPGSLSHTHTPDADVRAALLLELPPACEERQNSHLLQSSVACYGTSPSSSTPAVFILASCCAKRVTGG